MRNNPGEMEQLATLLSLTAVTSYKKVIAGKQQTALDGSPNKIAFSRLDWGGNRHTSKLVIRD